MGASPIGTCGPGSTSQSFPAVLGPDLTYNGGGDALVAKVDPDGKLVYAGYLGGFEWDFAEGIAVDADGNAYVHGPVRSSESTFPVKVGPDLTYNGEADLFVCKVKAVPDAEAVQDNYNYCGYIGGAGSDMYFEDRTGSSGHLALGADGSAYISGQTKSREDTFPDGDGFGDLPGPDQTYNGGDYDAFVAKVKPDGSGLAYAGYIGGDGWDEGLGMAVDAAGHAYLNGDTSSTEDTFPVTVGPDVTHNGGGAPDVPEEPGAEYDAFVAKVVPDGSGLVYAGFLGGAEPDMGQAVALDAGGNLYVAGWTMSTEATFPAIGGPDITHNDGVENEGDAFLVKIKADPRAEQAVDNLHFGGFIGGAAYDVAFWLAVDGDGSAYVVGDTESSADTFPHGDGTGGLPGWSRREAGGGDGFVVKVGEPGTQYPTPTPTSEPLHRLFLPVLHG